MIAPQRVPAQQQRPRVQERAREAARRRTRRQRLNGYAMLARICAITGILLAPVMLYVLLMGRLTALNYTLEKVMHDRTLLQEDSQRLDDRIARLKSPEHLAQLAAQLRMHDPHVYAVVDVPLPAATPLPSGIAFLGALFHK